MPPRLSRRAPLMPLAGLAIVLVAAISAFLISHNVATANDAVNRSAEVRVGIAELGAELARHDAGFRAYLIAGNSYQLERTREARTALVDRYRQLERLMADDPERAAELRALAPLIRKRLDHVHRHMVAKSRGGDGIARGAQRDSARTVLNQIHDRLQHISVEEQKLLEARQQQGQRLIVWLSLALAGAVLLVVVAAYLTVTDARQRFAALRAATRAARASAVEAAHQAAARGEAEAQLHQIQKMESIGQLTGGIAHDFNNMLAVIVGSLDLARRRMDDPEKVARHISAALEGAGRATTLVSRLLAFSRRQALTPVAIDSDGFLVDLADLLRRTLGETIAIEISVDPATWTIFADRVQLESAILNLAVNARDAMPQGGRLTLAAANRQLGPGAEAAHADLIPGDYVEIAVIDSGSGMAAEVIARAFDPFFTTKAVGKGTGLGLSQVFGFVRQSGGHVTIDSKVGSGTAVRLLLPRHRGLLGNPNPRGPLQGMLGGHGERILLAEDDDRVRDFSADALRELGYVPLVAANGPDALGLLDADRDIAMLFTDVVMPGMSGQELAAAVTARRPGIKILYTTGYARDGDNALGLARLDAPILHKPFGIAELGAKLRELLDD